MVAPFVFMPEEIGFNRFTYIAEGLVRRGYAVTMVTSGFSHYLKKKRNRAYIPDAGGYDVYFIDEPGYKSNVSVKRAFSHLIFLLRLRVFLSHHACSYDLVYAAIPMAGSAFLASCRAVRDNAGFIVDVQDLWPEAQAFVLPGPYSLWRIFLSPASAIVKHTYAVADAVVGVSETYLKAAGKKVSSKVPVRPIYIGTKVEKFSKRPAQDLQNTGPMKRKPLELVYIGTLGSSYDVKTVFRALYTLSSKMAPVPRLTIIGDGPNRQPLKRMAAELKIPVVFLGTVTHEELAKELPSYDLAVNPYYKGAMQSLTNKLADYLAAGLPVMNAANNKEVERLMEKYEMGYNYEPENHEELCALIESLGNRREEIHQRSLNARAFAEKYMDRNRIYKELFHLVEDCL